MEKLYFNLSEEEITKSRKILLWTVTGLFIAGGIYVAMLNPVFGKEKINPALSLPSFGIGLIIGATAAYATIKRKDIYFLIDDEKVEFRYGIFRPKKYSFPWKDMKKIVMPHMERKAKIMFHNGKSYTINLSYIQRKKSTIIRKHLFHAAKYNNVEVLTVVRLAHYKAHHQHATA